MKITIPGAGEHNLPNDVSKETAAEFAKWVHSNLQNPTVETKKPASTVADSALKILSGD